MTLSTNFSANKPVAILLFILTGLSGCGTTTSSARSATSSTHVDAKRIHIALLPVHNLSGAPAPLKEMRQLLVQSLKKQGLSLIDETVVQKFIAVHRVRYAGGINRATAQALKEETGADAVLTTALELYSERNPPKISLMSRLVSTEEETAIVWMDGIGLAGDDFPGLLGLSMIEDPHALLEKALGHLSTSLSQYLKGTRDTTAPQEAMVKFQPKFYYSSPVMTGDMKYRVAVIPFLNLSDRKRAGEIIGLHFTRQLRAFENFSVIEPGAVRHALLALRIIMDDGISLAHADIIFSRLNADLILTGKVMDYQDYEGPTGKAKVDFSALMIERKSREVVWSAKSHNQGDERVFFFDMGKINTAHAMASQMVQLAVGTIFQ